MKGKMNNYQKILKEKLEELHKQLHTVSDQDPYNREDYSDENTQDDDASEREEHTRVEAIELDLKERIKLVEKALNKIKKGNYGVCENCGGKIDRARLEVLPESKFCLDCQRKEQ